MDFVLNCRRGMDTSEYDVVMGGVANGMFAKLAEITLDEALRFFYGSQLYRLVKNGVSDMHCMSDMYLAEELLDEYNEIEK